MDSTNIELPGSVIAGVSQQGDEVRISFEPAYLVKHMTGSVERTRWHQQGELIFAEAEIADAQDLPDFPVTCAGGDVGENVYTYRNMVPVPLESRGRAHCVLRFKDSAQELRITAAGVRLEMVDVPKYIEHLRPGD